MSKLELKIMPPLVVLIFAIAMWAVSLITPPLDFLLPYRDVLSRTFIAFGVLILSVAGLYFLKAKTTINPMRPKKSSALVTAGLYKFSRNPIYIADILFLIGWGFYLSNPFSLALVLGFAPYLTHFQITPEERELEQLFGHDYIAYKTKVRRWI